MNNYKLNNFNWTISEEEDEELVDLETFNRHLWANFPYRVRDPESGELYLPLPVYVDPEPENESETNANDTAHEAGTSREDSQPTDNVTAANNQSEEHNDSAEASKQWFHHLVRKPRVFID